MSGITTFLFRKLPKSFNRAIRPRGACEINVEKAEMQHENFRRIVTSRMKRDNYVVLSPAESFPDSVFIEDSCVSLCEGIAVATTPSAPTRQGESGLMRPFLESLAMTGQLDCVYNMHEKCDGGDVLCIGKHVFVGASQRTNKAAHARWRQICHRHDMSCTSIPIENSLHLKSVVTWLNEDIGLIAEKSADGYRAAEIITSALPRDLQSVHFVDFGANMLRINKTVIHQPGLFLRNLYRRHPQLEFVECDMSELNKAGGALTCGVVALRTTEKED